MLYRTVFGSELETIYNLIAEVSRNEKVSREQIYSAFILGHTDHVDTTTQNLDDALLFLVSAQLVFENIGAWQPSQTTLLGNDFRIQAIYNLRQLQLGGLSAKHAADSTYMVLLDELYAKQRTQFVYPIHIAANQLDPVRLIGGLNREKLQGWCRVMSFLGLGVRLNGSFLYAPDPMLIYTIITLSGQMEGILQDLVENHLVRFLPCQDHSGGLTNALEASLATLHRLEKLELFALQDSPSRPYIGAARYRGYRILTPNQSPSLC